MKMKKIGRFFLIFFVFLFILSLLAWSVPVLGAQEEGPSLEDLKETVFEQEKTVSSDLNISEPKILPESLIYFLKIGGESLTRFSKRGYLRKIESNIESASRRLLETRALVFKDRLENKKIIRSLTRYQKAVKSVRSRFFDLLSSSDFNFEDENLFIFLTDSFVGWQRILGEIQYKSQDPEVISLAQKIFKENSEVLPHFMAGFGGNESLAKRLDSSFDKDRSGFFERFLNLSILNSLEKNLSNYNQFEFWFLEQKTKGKALAEFLNNYQKFREEIKTIFDLTPFISPEERNDAIKKLIIEEDNKKLISLLKDFSQTEEELKNCSQENVFQNQSRLKRIENEGNYPNWLDIEEFKRKTLKSQSYLDDEKWIESCLLSKEANDLYKAINQIQFFYLNKDEVNLEIDRLKILLKETEKKLEEYDAEGQARVFELAKILKDQFEKIVIFNNNYQDFFEEVVQFWRRFEDLEKAMDNKSNLFSSPVLIDFSHWCWLERGRLVKDLSVWPECILPGGEPVSLTEWNIDIRK